MVVMFKNKKNSFKRIVTYLSVGTIVIVVVAILLELAHVINFYEKNNKQSTPTQPSINFDPPTEDEQKAGDKKKQEIKSEQETTSKPNIANVVIVDANQYDSVIEARAFVSNALESGTCYFEFIKEGSRTVSRETPAIPDASTTPCITVTVPRDEFTSPGVWILNVTYKSTSISGNSSQELTLQ